MKKEKKKVCIISAASIDLDNRLKKTISFFDSLDFDVVITTFTRNLASDANEWQADFELVDGCFFFQPSDNKSRILRILWNTLIFNPSRLFIPYSLPATGLGKRAASTRADLYYIIGIESVPEALYLTNKTKKPIIYDSYEYFASLLENEIYFKSSLKNKVFKHFEKKLVTNKSTTMIVVNEEIAQGYSSRYGVRMPEVIYNCSLESIKNIEKHNEITFYFQSYLRPTYNIEGLIDAFSEIKGDAKLVIQGEFLDKTYEDTLRQYIGMSKRVDDISLVGACGYDEVVKVAAHYDVGVFAYRKKSNGELNENNLLSLPNKFFTYISAGLCLASSSFPVQRRFIEQAGCGVLFDPDNVSDFIRTLQYLADHPLEVNIMRRHSLNLAKVLSIEETQKRFREIVYNVLKEGNPVG